MRIFLSLMMFIAVSLPAVAQNTAATVNLLPNSSFEESAPGGVRDWKSRAWQGGEHGRWLVDAPAERANNACPFVPRKGRMPRGRRR